MSHALIVGGTGMLANVCLYLADCYSTVSVIARNKPRFCLHSEEFSFLNHISVDYRDTENLQKSLHSTIEKYGSINLVVCWIHATAPQAPFIIAESIKKNDTPCRYLHVLGSAFADPSGKAEELQKKFEQYSDIEYSQVILGFQFNGAISRWLTKDEISNGVIRAIQSTSRHEVVGMVKPWERRP